METNEDFIRTLENGQRKKKIKQNKDEDSLIKLQEKNTLYYIFFEKNTTRRRLSYLIQLKNIFYLFICLDRELES